MVGSAFCDKFTASVLPFPLARAFPLSCVWLVPDGFPAAPGGAKNEICCGPVGRFGPRRPGARSRCGLLSSRFSVPRPLRASHPVFRPSLCFVSLPAALSSQRPSCPRICWFALTPAACGYPAPGNVGCAPGSEPCLLWPVGRVRRSSPLAKTDYTNVESFASDILQTLKFFLCCLCR